MATDVMSQPEADAVFDRLEAITGLEELSERVALGEDFADGQVGVRYPHKLPGKKLRIYDTRVGYSSDVLPYMLPNVMKMTWPDGTPKYSRRQLVEPPVGNVPCFLHESYPDRERVQASGVGHVRCTKLLVSRMHAERHAETRHGDSYKVYRRHIQDEREDEQREFQRLQVEVMRRQLEGSLPAQKKAG